MESRGRKEERPRAEEEGKAEKEGIGYRQPRQLTRAKRLKTQASVLACLQVVYPSLSVAKEQSLSASLVRLEKELFQLYLAENELEAFAVRDAQRLADGYDPPFRAVCPLDGKGR